jgi:YegS/Rv2252/BmrU family lipid kinase
MYNKVMADALLVYNPAAGRISVRPFVGGVVRALNDHGWRVEVAETLNGRHTTQLARIAAQENFKAVFAVGGDGTAGQAASGLIGSGTALGVLPAGTTNVWAQEIGIHAFTMSHLQALRHNVRMLAEAEPCAMDIGLCNGQPFLMWAGVGLDAMAVKKLASRKRFEKYINKTEFGATAIWNAAIWHGMDLRVTWENKQVEGHYLLGVANNIRHYGAGNISPYAYLDDGYMDLWLFAGRTLGDAFRGYIELQSRRHLASEQVRCIPFREAVIQSDTPFSLQLDGEPMLGAREVKLEVLKGKLQVLMPAHARHLLQNDKMIAKSDSEKDQPVAV